MAEPKYRVKMPGAHIGQKFYYGIEFINGEAQNVPDGFHMGDFKDRGFIVEPMVPPPTKKEKAEDERPVVAGGKKAPTAQRGRKRG